MKVPLCGGIGPLRPALAHWSPYTPHDLCGYPSGLEGLGAYAPAQSVYSFHDGMNVRLRGGIQTQRPDELNTVKICLGR